MRINTKVPFLLAFVFLISFSSFAQRGVRIGYIDTEYILQNVPEYQDASVQLDAKVQKWKSEIELRLSEIDQKKKQLNSESVLLTKELIEERQEEINIEESEVLDYQQKRFGPNGDLMIQRKNLMQPIQDQIFTAVQEIAANKKYDFVFDKSADVVMLYSAKRFDISDQVLRSITRSSKRKQVQNRKERKAAEEEELVPEINKEQEAREKVLADKKAERAKNIEDKRNKQLEAREAKKKALEDKKKKILEDRAKAREEKINARKGISNNKEETKTEDVKKENNNAVITEKKEETTLSPSEAKKKALEDKKKKILADRKAKLEASKGKTVKENDVKAENDSIKTVAPKLTDREARKKALEDKKKKILADRKAKLEARKKAKDSTSIKKNN
ncbi:MAG: OmpH family outer membrane protein [Flavobacteriaceae bacterium]|nr:OmpH family outer membrane protein [Flavobacteriaceae bacterium]